MIENIGLQNALNHFLGPANELESELVQSLWGGYGAIHRVWTANNDCKTSAQYCIAKAVNLQQQGQHPRGWNTTTSHQRKLSSYINEQRFYKYYASHTSHECQVPLLYAAHADDKSIWMIMQDLNTAGFVKRSTHPSLPLVLLGVKWLANFHACFISDLDKISRVIVKNDPIEDTKLWPVGTYWHLATRGDEWNAMPESSLKAAASEIDKRLNQARYQTIVHGDAKLANFCIHHNESALAAVDFQYVGRGVGIKDFVYFLGSCLDSEGLHEHAPRLLSEYLKTLQLASKDKLNDFTALENEYRSLYSYAWADFERFLTGWSPGHKKLNSYSAQQTQIALKELRY